MPGEEIVKLLFCEVTSVHAGCDEVNATAESSWHARGIQFSMLANAPIPTVRVFFVNTRGFYFLLKLPIVRLTRLKVRFYWIDLDAILFFLSLRSRSYSCYTFVT